MGIAGTEVSKEASDMILQDDNFSTIVAAVEEGRAIFENMKAFIRYMISSNIGEVISIFVSSMLGLPDSFSSIQLLWVNLVTDGLPATALSFNPSDPDVMLQMPRDTDESIVNKKSLLRYMSVGIYIGVTTVGIFIYWYCYYDWSEYEHPLVTYDQLRNWSECPHWENFKLKPFTLANGHEYDFHDDPCEYFDWGKQKASTMSLTILVLIEMFNAINALSQTKSLLQTGLFLNPLLILACSISFGLHLGILYSPFFGDIFGVDPLSKNDWIICITLAFPVILIDEVVKIFVRIQMAKDMKLRRKAHSSGQAGNVPSLDEPEISKKE